MNFLSIVYTTTVFLFLFINTSIAQITLERSHFEKLLGPDRQNYLYADTTDSVFQVDIGKPGGPHVYEFTDFNFSLIDTTRTMPVDHVSQLVQRFPGDAIALKIFEFLPGQADSFTAYYYDIYHFLDDGVYIYGEALVTPFFEQYVHFTPQELFVPYPMTFGTTYSSSFTANDTSFYNGVPLFTDSWTVNANNEADGWGTLVLPGFGSFSCIRWNENDAAGDYKAINYLTQEGYMLNINTNTTQPDSGIITVESIGLFVPESVTNVEQPKRVPQEFALLKNYPNPFNPSTTITFKLNQTSKIVLRIYNALGQEIKTLIDGYQTAGSKSITWNGTDYSGNTVSSGLYIYSLQTGNKVESRKMLFIK